MGTVPSPRVLRVDVPELYDYDDLRRTREATMFVVRVERATLVLGGSQRLDALNLERLNATPLLRRRGGGGLVLLQPGDLWIDWWIPSDDARWSKDVHVSSINVGRWWHYVLRERVKGQITVHDGPMAGDPAHRLVCFAGRGPGEVFVDDRKAVGVTQWRVREGVFVSSVLPARSSSEILEYLSDVPEGLDDALDHHVLTSLFLGEPDELIGELRRVSGPWRDRVIDPGN